MSTEAARIMIVMRMPIARPNRIPSVVTGMFHTWNSSVPWVMYAGQITTERKESQTERYTKVATSFHRRCDHTMQSARKITPMTRT